MIITLQDIVEKSASSALAWQRDNGAFSPGHNGPYNDPETPVRNTAHFLFLYSVLYQKTGNSHYRTAGEKAISYLLSPDARPFGKTFYCRDKAGKDKCNGLVGQAWVVEALVMASRAFDRSDCYDLAEKIFMIHPWDNNIALWGRVDTDGKCLTYDGTFNHQLWFAAAGSLLYKSPIAISQARTFLRKIAYHVQTYPNGVIFHSSSMGNLRNFIANGPKAFSRELRTRFRNKMKMKELYSKSIGYHGFNLYALAILKERFLFDKFWGSNKFKKLINICNDTQFQEVLQNSEFGYHYNLSGIEIAYAMEIFSRNKKDGALWIERQFKKSFLKDNYSLSLRATDKNTAFARIYEATRLTCNYHVEVI